MTGTTMTDDFTEEQKNALISKGLLFEQLLQSDKFIPFFKMNYDLMKDEDTQTVYLVEVPDEVARERAMEMAKEQIKDAPQVVPATPADLKELTSK